MSTQTTQPLSLLHVDFNDLYARHLGRHSQFGINVGHLAALYGLWFGVYATLYQAVLVLGVPTGWLIIVALAVTYLAIVAINAPYHVVPRDGGLPGLLRRECPRPAEAASLVDPGVRRHDSGLLQIPVLEPQDLDRSPRT